MYVDVNTLILDADMRSICTKAFTMLRFETIVLKDSCSYTPLEIAVVLNRIDFIVLKPKLFDATAYSMYCEVEFRLVRFTVAM